MNNTALRAEVRSTNNTHMVFANEEHEKFYYEKLEQARYQDCYHKALIYILGISEDTRNHFSQIYVLFDTFNGDALHIGGVKVDINPITAQRTGTLETYLPQVEDYLEGVREAREKAPVSITQEQAVTEVTLTVAECGEFHNLGEFYENIPTVEEAVAIWKQIPPERMNGIPAIGINIHTPGTEAFEDVGMDILSGNRIDLDILEYIPDIKGNLQAMEIITELVAKLPEMEIDGHLSEEMEAKVWEKRMPDLTPAEQLAVEIDRFIYGYDTALYHDNNQSMTENVSEIAEALNQRDTRDMALWFADIAADGTEPEERKRRKRKTKRHRTGQPQNRP